jgi:hypothetical protein
VVAAAGGLAALSAGLAVVEQQPSLVVLAQTQIRTRTPPLHCSFASL